jgi:hypothetical protein
LDIRLASRLLRALQLSVFEQPSKASVFQHPASRIETSFGEQGLKRFEKTPEKEKKDG